MRFLPLLLLFICFACKTDYPGQEPVLTPADAPVPVEIVAIQPTTAPLPIEAGGTIGAKEEARLSFKIGGVVDRVYAREGQYVRRGATLATLKTTEIDAQTAKAQRAVDKLERDLARTQTLLAEGAATQENVDDLTTALAVAQSDLDIATFNRRYAAVRAPVGGRVVRRFVEPGELVGPGNPVFQLTGERPGGFVLRVGVADRDVVQLALGDSASVRLDAYDGLAVPARVTEIAAAADPRSGTFGVELTLEAGNRPLRNGFIGRATVYPSRTPPHYRVPLDALVEGSGRQITIFSPTPDRRAAATEVRFTRLLDNAFVVPAADLAGITQIITRGSGYLAEGDSITSSAPIH